AGIFVQIGLLPNTNWLEGLALRLIGGQIAPDHGEILFDGENIPVAWFNDWHAALYMPAFCAILVAFVVKDFCVMLVD
ncbi:hypothetical protein O5269_28665, partial [Escherichia coli]|nr:hypothetical protein [Escherichia coli]